MSRPARTLITTLTLAAGTFALPASGDRLAFPDWSSLYTPRGAIVADPSNTGTASFIREGISAGRALDSTARIPRLVETASDDAIAVRRVYLENMMRPLRINPRHDLGNVYAFVRDSDHGMEHVYAAAEHLRSSTGKTTIDFELNREPQKFIVNQAITRISGRELAGDIKARVFLKDGLATQFMIQRRISGAWRLVGRYRFNAAGCAGTYALAIACIKDLPKGGPVPGQRTATLPGGREVVVPATNEMIEVGFNVARIVNRSAQFSNLSIRTPQDIAVGTLNAPSRTSPVNFARLQ